MVFQAVFYKQTVTGHGKPLPAVGRFRGGSAAVNWFIFCLLLRKSPQESQSLKLHHNSGEIEVDEMDTLEHSWYDTLHLRFCWTSLIF